MTKKAIITIGISASGKTTWAEQQKDYVVISRDDVRRQILESKLDRELKPGELWAKWKFKDEDEVTKIVQIFIKDCSDNNKNIIIADTNLVEKYRALTKIRLEELGYVVEMRSFDVDFDEACKRDAGRPDGVGHSVLMKQWLQYQDFKNFGEKYIPVKGTRKAIMIDLDGTLCLMKDRGPFDWNKVGQDDINPIVYHVIRGYYQQGYEIVIMSGRDSVCRKETELWLEKHNVPFTEMFMRAENDSRKDSIVKNELFWKHVAHNYDVECVIDDRPQVLRTWWSIGLKTLAVGNPLIEF